MDRHKWNTTSEFHKENQPSYKTLLTSIRLKLRDVVIFLGSLGWDPGNRMYTASLIYLVPLSDFSSSTADSTWEPGLSNSACLKYLKKSLVPHFYPKMHRTFTILRNASSLQLVGMVVMISQSWFLFCYDKLDRCWLLVNVFWCCLYFCLVFFQSCPKLPPSLTRGTLF